MSFHFFFFFYRISLKELSEESVDGQWEYDGRVLLGRDGTQSLTVCQVMEEKEKRKLQLCGALIGSFQLVH